MIAQDTVEGEDPVANIWAAIDARVRFGIKPGLERMERLLAALYHPEHAYRVIHVAGTNGKGSVCNFVEQGLRRAGRRTGLYTSPHLLSPLERIVVDGQPLAIAALVSAWNRLEPLLGSIEPSYFELLTALAFVAFREAGVEVAVIECGLGGRWDATNVVRSELAVLTSVGLDHMAILGNSLAAIAEDKSAIARPAYPFVIGELAPEARTAVARVADERGTVALFPDNDEPTLFRQPEGNGMLVGDGQITVRLPLAGGGACRSADLALRILRRLPEAAVLQALPTPLDLLPLPGRLQLLRIEPPLLLDVAHNPSALELLATDLERLWPGVRWTVVFAAMSDKDFTTGLLHLAPVIARVVPLALDHPRVAAPDVIRRAAQSLGLSCDDTLDPAALDRWRHAPPLVPLLVTGSFLPVAAWLGGTEHGLPPGL